jgi:predicted ABC-class ATPase
VLIQKEEAINLNKLQEKLMYIDGKGYKAYKDIRGIYTYSEFQLSVDYVQGDPFASPSKIRILIDTNLLPLEESWIENEQQVCYCEDLIARKVGNILADQISKSRGTGKSGNIAIDRPGQEVLKRSAVTVTSKVTTICLSVGLPAAGRRILGKQAEKMFLQEIPTLIRKSALAITGADFEQVVKLCDQQQAIRQYLDKNDLIAFIANESILPRENGISNRPLQKGKVVPFHSPASLEIEIDIPHAKETIKGLGIKKGITLIVGGGFHGKSTLLHALERGVYNHIRGDGREFVLTNQNAVKIRSEDGRSVNGVNISPFINNLPYQQDTTHFTSENASGSTSQAANIMEAIEAGAQALLIDEDTSATNFMIRDARMQALVSAETEPITPFVDKIGQLLEEQAISTTLVMGGSGDYFSIADTIIKMENYLPYDVTQEAQDIAERIKIERNQEGGNQFGSFQPRIPHNRSLNSRKGKKSKIASRGKNSIQFGMTTIDLHHVEQLVDESQTRMIAEILYYWERKGTLNNKSISELLDEIEEIQKQGFHRVSSHSGHPGELAVVRRFELAAALNRMRSLQIK